MSTAQKLEQQLDLSGSQAYQLMIHLGGVLKGGRLLGLSSQPPSIFEDVLINKLLQFPKVPELHILGNVFGGD